MSPGKMPADWPARRRPYDHLPAERDVAERATSDEVPAERLVMLVVGDVADVRADLDVVGHVVVRGEIQHVIFRNGTREDAGGPEEVFDVAVFRRHVELRMAVADPRVV